MADLPNDNGGTASNGRRISLCLHEERFEINELSQPGLHIPLGQVAPRRADETHIGHVGLLRRLDQLNRDVDLVLIGRGNQTHGVGLGFLKRVDRISHLAWLVSDDLRPQLGQVFASLCICIECETGYSSEFSFESGIAEEELGDQEARLALG